MLAMTTEVREVYMVCQECGKDPKHCTAVEPCKHWAYLLRQANKPKTVASNREIKEDGN
jgi:hypothetical protein